MRIVKGIAVVVMGMSVCSCGMMSNKPTNFLDTLTTGLATGNGLYVTMGDARGIEAHANYQNGMVTSAKIDSEHQKTNPYWTVEAQKADQTNKLEAQKLKTLDAQQKLQNLVNSLKGGN